jgi:hypothetical protein
MASEGARVLWASKIMDYPPEADKLLVAEIYRAMRAQSLSDG